MAVASLGFCFWLREVNATDTRTNELQMRQRREKVDAFIFKKPRRCRIAG
jgi:hypothetical protein